MPEQKTGKLQVFWDNEFLQSATLRRCDDELFPYFILCIYATDGYLVYKNLFDSAKEAKDYLEQHDKNCKWHTVRGYVCDDV